MRWTVRRKMIALVVLPLLVIYVAISAFTLRYLERTSLDQIKIETTRLAQSHAARFDGYLREAAAIANATARFIEIEPDLTERQIFDQLAANTSQLPFIYGAAMAFEPGSFLDDDSLFCPYVFRSGEGFSELNLTRDVMDWYGQDRWQWWAKPKASGESVWTDPYFDEGAGNILMVTYSVPFVREGKFRGVTTVDIAMPNLNETVGRNIVGDQNMFVLTGDGTFVFSSRPGMTGANVFDQAKEQNRPELAALARRVSSGASGTTQIKDADGVASWASYAPIESAGWAFATSVTEAEALAPVRAQVAFVLGALLLTLVLIVIEIFVVSGRFVRPILTLRSKVREIADGNLDATVHGINTNDELGELATAFNQMTADLRANVASLAHEQAARQKIERDLDIAREIQRGLLPSDVPDIPGFEIAGWNQPCDQTGGDFYDWLELPDGRIVVVLADVTGHGIGPALIVAVCRAYIRASTSAPDLDLAHTVAHVNDLLHKDMPANRFVTAAIGVIDPKTQQMEFLSAGQAPVLFYDAKSGTVDMSNADALPLGITDDAEPAQSRTFHFNPGDALLLTTDGFFEWANAHGEQFGIKRLTQFLLDNHDLPGDDMIERLHQMVVKHAAGTPQDDDLTAVVVRCVGPNPVESAQ